MVEIVRAVKFRYDFSPVIYQLLHDFRDMLNFCLARAFETNSFGIKKLYHACYSELRKRYDYNSRYIVSAIKTAVSILRSWNRRKRDKPVARKLFINFSPLLTRFEGGKVRISVKPREFLTIQLKYGRYQQKFVNAWRAGKMRVGEIRMNKDWVMVPFKEEIDLTKPNDCVAIDLNETNITAVDSKGNCLIINTSKLRAMHTAYASKMRKIQRIGDSKAKRRLIAKYSGKRKRRIRDLLHKLTKSLSAFTSGKTLLLERLTGLRYSVNKKVKAYNRFSRRIQPISKNSKRLKRRLNLWNFRLFQFMLDYKHKLNGLDVVYLDPCGTSSSCFRCEGRIAPMERACPACGLDRHVSACLNLLKMWGSCSGYPESLLMSVMKLECRSFSADEVNQAELREEAYFSTAC